MHCAAVLSCTCKTGRCVDGLFYRGRGPGRDFVSQGRSSSRGQSAFLLPAQSQVLRIACVRTHPRSIHLLGWGRSKRAMIRDLSLSRRWE
jgi:hypothetical protein